MLEPGDSVEFSFWEAGCMIWVGSLPAYESFCQAWFQLENNVIKTDPKTIASLILEEKAIMPLPLYQDDGYYTRVIFRDMNERELEDWTGRATWQLNLPTGQLVVSGVVDADLDVSSLAEVGTDGCLQLYLDVPPGEYQVTIYAYPPGDLSTGWGQIENPKLFRPTPGIEPEDLWSYFHRTRPEEPIPDWLGKDYAPTSEARQAYDRNYENSNGHVNFVVQLLPLAKPIPAPTLDEENFLEWEFRKPERFPLGISIEVERELF